MNEPKVLNVGEDKQLESVKGESGLGSANVGTSAQELQQNNEDSIVYVANENQVVDNSKSLSVSQDTPKGRYVEQTERLGGFERSKGDKNVVNTITVDEVKALIKQYGGGSSDTYTKTEIDAIVETMRKGLYQEVDTEEYATLEAFLASDGEEGIIYLYPVGNEGNNYYQYIWETDHEWISLGTTVVDLSQYAKLTLLAPNYDATATYSVGQKVNYNGKLYTCSTAITQAEDFDATHWTEISVSGGFMDLDSAQTTTGQKTFSALTRFSDYTIVSGTLAISGLIDSNLRPTITNSKDLGTSSLNWKDLYLSGKISDGTNEVAISDLATIKEDFSNQVALDNESSLTILRKECVLIKQGSSVKMHIYISGKNESGANVNGVRFSNSSTSTITISNNEIANAIKDMSGNLISNSVSGQIKAVVQMWYNDGNTTVQSLRLQHTGENKIYLYSAGYSANIPIDANFILSINEDLTF